MIGRLEAALISSTADAVDGSMLKKENGVGDVSGASLCEEGFLIVPSFLEIEVSPKVFDLNFWSVHRFDLGRASQSCISASGKVLRTSCWRSHPLRACLAP